MSDDPVSPSRPNTLPGFPKVDQGASVGAPIMVPEARVAHAPTELALPAVALSPETIALAEAVHEGADAAVVLIEPGGYLHVLARGTPVLNQLGRTFEDVVADPTALLPDNDDIRLLAAYRSTVDEAGKRSVVRFQCQDRTGGLVPLEARFHNLGADGAGAVVVHVVLAALQSATPPSRRDNLPQLERVEDRESFIAHAQRVIDRKVAKVWSAPAHARAVMRDRRWDYALMLIYLDRFNILLGGFGPDALTTVCVDACARIRKVLRSQDAVAPVGATEIAVLLEGVSDPDHIDRLTELVLDTLKAGINVGGTNITLVPIAGIATSARRYDDTALLLQDAAAAAGRALMQGRGAHHEVFQTEFRTETVHRMGLMADLKDGIDREELFLLYQPLHSLADGSCTALEAFVRWRHPERGLVMPGDFIPLAEETGLIRPLTQWVLAAGCSAMMALAPAGQLRLHINVGAAELSDPGFYDSVMAALEQAQLTPQRLCLDMSESALVDSSNTARDTMHRLGAKDVRFALDDYGTGASSLRYLADLPFDYVKIDTSISQQVGDAQRRIATAMIGLAHELGRQVIAEGVESDAQRMSLAELGSDEAQGYFFSKPLEREAIAKRLTAGHL